jgi:hypothetical protein
VLRHILCLPVAHKFKSLFVPSCGTFCAFLWHILCLPVAHGILFTLVKNCKARIAKKSILDSLDIFFSRLNEWKNFQSCFFLFRAKKSFKYPIWCWKKIVGISHYCHLGKFVVLWNCWEFSMSPIFVKISECGNWILALKIPTFSECGNFYSINQIPTIQNPVM